MNSPPKHLSLLTHPINFRFLCILLRFSKRYTSAGITIIWRFFLWKTYAYDRLVLSSLIFPQKRFRFFKRTFHKKILFFVELPVLPCYIEHLCVFLLTHIMCCTIMQHSFVIIGQQSPNAREKSEENVINSHCSFFLGSPVEFFFAMLYTLLIERFKIYFFRSILIECTFLFIFCSKQIWLYIS